MPVLLASAAGFSAISSIAGGFAGQKAANDEADLQVEQGNIALAESKANAANEAYNQNQAVSKQQLAFLANGVSLEGSPADVLKESTKYGQAQVDSVLRQGVSQYSLAQKQAAATKNQGRTALLAGITQGLGTASTLAYAGSKGGIFDPTKKGTP